MDIKICGTEGHSFLVKNVMESSGAASKTTGLVVVEANNKARYCRRYYKKWTENVKKMNKCLS